MPSRLFRTWLIVVVRYPEIQCVYDLEFPADQSIIPKPNDSEVDSFGLYTTDEVVQLLVNGEFKPYVTVLFEQARLTLRTAIVLWS